MTLTISPFGNPRENHKKQLWEKIENYFLFFSTLNLNHWKISLSDDLDALMVLHFYLTSSCLSIVFGWSNDVYNLNDVSWLLTL